MPILVESLKNIPCFSGLSVTELQSISRFILEERVDKGKTIIWESESADFLYIIASGLVKIFKTSPDGKEQILEILKPGDIVNMVSLLDRGPNLTSAITLASATFFEIRRVDLDLLLKTYPQLAINLTKLLARRVRHLTSLVEDLSFKNVTSRIAKILLENAAEPGSGPRFTQQEIAAMAGTVREVVGRSLKALQGSGVIRLDRHRVVITNKKALAEIATASS